MNTKSTGQPHDPQPDPKARSNEATASNEELMAEALAAFGRAVDARVGPGATLSEREAASLDLARRIARRSLEKSGK